ncbi:M13 family metallopeptidase N-terminal domain-containing protein, partial [uncultured Sphingomonas sp.]
MRVSRLVSTILASTIAVTALAAQDGPRIGTYGFDTKGMDTSVKPGDDFDRFASGTWEKTTEIPADRASWGMFHVLQDQSLAQTHAILEESAKRPGTKIGDFYAAYMDEATIAKKGLTPVKPWLNAIAGAKDKSALAIEAAKLQTKGVGGLFGMGVTQDSKAPDTYVVMAAQSGTSLPDRDYYLKDDVKLAAIRTAYQGYLTQLLTLAGESNAQARAAAVFEFEKALATAHWSRVENRDADKTYNKWTFADFETKAPGYPWGQAMGALGVPKQRFYIVRQPSAVTGEAKAFADAPLAVLKDYYMLRVLKSYASVLPKPFEQADFAFTGTVLSGVPQQQSRWKRAVSATSGSLGEEVGKLYVARYFPPASKAEMDKLVVNVRAAMHDRL